jgi:dATP pyrophosphohydrolase
MPYKVPVSVLVVIYTSSLDVLLLERADHPGYWQSVTGSQDEGETLHETAVRELAEETGLDAGRYALTDWQQQNVYEIYPTWRYRYAPGITHNTEHVFGLELPSVLPVQLSPREHLNYVWLPWQQAADKVFSPSNRAAILQLPQRAEIQIPPSPPFAKGGAERTE